MKVSTGRQWVKRPFYEIALGPRSQARHAEGIIGIGPE